MRARRRIVVGIAYWRESYQAVVSRIADQEREIKCEDGGVNFLATVTVVSVAVVVVV